MKVLFAVNNENISEAIVKKYQKKYKEIISYKNVYYFNAILKEIQKDKSYDRIVISEDLEQFTNTSYEQMDKFIFDRLDSISDEATNMKGIDIPIILICTERRTKSEEILVKLFGIGIYNAIIGNDRSVDEVCRLINKPRLKKEAKAYYKIDSDEVSYKAETEDDVSEIEIQNIIAHFKRLGKNEEKYIDSFNNIAAQYNDNQLRVIGKYLPLGVKAVLEEQSSKYQKIMSFNNQVSQSLRRQKEQNQKTGPTEKLLNSARSNKTLNNPIVIPSAMKSADNVRKLVKSKPKAESETVEQIDTQDLKPISDLGLEPEVIQPIEVQEKPKRGRGRPRKNPVPVEADTLAPKKKRGRPRKNPLPEEVVEEKEEVEVLPGFEDGDMQEDMILPGFDESSINDKNEEFTVLPELEESEEDDFELPGLNGTQEIIEPRTVTSSNVPPRVEPIIPKIEPAPQVHPINNEASSYTYTSSANLSSLLQGDKKVAAFVGTSKNGTSFIVNNLAEQLSLSGVNVAILDTTKNRNSYFIYTKNEENLRKIAISSIDNLENGVAEGIKVNNNLTVYTSLPGEGLGIENVQAVLATLIQNHTVVLIDCDFSTPKGYFAEVQEVYLVQTMDVLTIQPLTAFLKELMAQNILEEQKIRIIINKYVKIRGISEKEIIGGMAYYNDPAMTFMTGLFDRNLVKYISIPFEEETYVRYLEGLINCEISLKGHSKVFMQSLKQLGNMVYPLISGKGTYKPPTSGYNSGFSSSMNSTLDQMKRNY